MQEIWKDIEGYERYYQVSNIGRVRSLDRIVKHSAGRERISYGKVLSQSLDGGGYPTVGISKDGCAKRVHIHRLVAVAFIPNFDNSPEVNHLDENKLNNRANNLEWCTRKENERWGTKRERCILHTDYRAISEKNSKQLVQMDLSGNVIKVWKSLASLCRSTGFSQGNISMCCNGKYSKPLYGCTWKYSEG